MKIDYEYVKIGKKLKLTKLCKSFPWVMVGSATCERCMHNKGINDRSVECGVDDAESKT